MIPTSCPLLSEEFCAALNRRFEEARIRKDTSNPLFNLSSVPHLIFETTHNRASGELRGQWGERIGRATLLPRFPVAIKFEVRVRDLEEAVELWDAAHLALEGDVHNVQTIHYDIGQSDELRLPLKDRHLVRPATLNFEYPDEYDPWDSESIRQGVFVPARSVRGAKSPFLALQTDYYGPWHEPG